MESEANVRVYPATIKDIPLLVRHHRRMFEDILYGVKPGTIAIDYGKIDRVYAEKLTHELGDTCNAWVIRSDRDVIASGAVSILSMVPVPHDYACTVGYVHSIFTEKEFRHNGFARILMEQAMAFCKSRGIKRLILNASEAGQPLYEAMGFKIVNNSMRIFLE